MKHLWPVLALLGLTSSNVCWGYIPPSQFLIKTLVGKHASTKGIRIRSVVTALDSSGKPLEARFRVINSFDPVTRVLRSWATDASDQKLYRVERQPSEQKPITFLTLDSSLPDVTRVLMDRGIPIRTEEELLKLTTAEERRNAEVLSLRRWKKSPTWVIGRIEKNEPQLWLEKDSFLPLRFVFKPVGEDPSREIQLEGYRFYQGFPWPKLITVLGENDTPLMQEEVFEVTFATPLPEMKGSVDPQGFTEAGNSLPSATRALIGSYFQTLR